MIDKKENGTVTRTLVRNFEVPVRDGKRVIRSHQLEVNATAMPSINRESEATYRQYKNPELHSSARLLKDIEKLKKTVPKRLTLQDLTPESKAITNAQITRVLNFRHDEHVFTDLVPLNVNDSVIMEERERPRIKHFDEHNRDPEPDLLDYLTPMSPLELLIPKPQFKPEIRVRKPNTDNYDYIYSILDGLRHQ